MDVEYEPDNDATIKTTVVKYTDRSKDELTMMQIQTHGKIIGRYTTPDEGERASTASPQLCYFRTKHKNKNPQEYAVQKSRYFLQNLR